MATTTSQLVRRVDFVPFSTRDIDAACAFYGTTLGLPRSVYVPERNYAEFETANVTISIVDGEKMGIGHHVNTIALALHSTTWRPRERSSKDAVCSSRARRSTPGFVT